MAYFRDITEQVRLEKAVCSKAGASVWRAFDPARGATVAVKLIPMAGGPEDAPLFVRAMNVLGGLAHPSLPELLDFGFTPDGKAFLVFEWTAGRGLDALAGGSPAQILPALIQAVDGLEALAQAGLAHHNVSPDNLLLATPAAPGDGAPSQVKLTGLGSALLRPADARIAGGGGAAAFAAPEIGTAAEAAAGAGSDVYSLALVACVLLGARVHGAESPAPRVSLPLGVSFELEDDQALVQILQRALCRDPGERPSCAELREAFHLALTGAAGPRPAPPATRIFLSPMPDDVLLAQALASAGAADDTHPSEPGDDTNPVFFEEALRKAAVMDPPPVPAAGEASPAAPEASAPELPELPPLPSLDAELFELHPSGEPEMPASPPPPSPPPPSPPTAPAAVAAPNAPPAPVRRRRWGLIAALAAVLAAFLALGGVGLVWWSSRGAGAPGMPAAAPAAVLPAVHRSPPPAPPRRASAPELAVPAVPAPLAAAAAAFAEGRDEEARLAIAAARDEGDLPPAACAIYLSLGSALEAAGRERLAADLRNSLRAGSLGALREALRRIGGDERTVLRDRPGIARELAQARRAVDLSGRLDRAVQAGDQPQVIALAGDLAAALPRYAGAAAARERAAAAIEAEADTLFQTGAVAAAQARMEPLARAWPDRPGLAERMSRYASEQRSDQSFQNVLAQAAAAAARKRPDEGLAVLRDARPSPRYEARFREERGRLERQLAALDKAPPAIQLANPQAEYEKGSAARIVLRVSDDFAVKSVVVHARAEGTAGYVDLQPVRSGADYTAEVPPSLHQNRTIEYYAVATDASGHRGELGTAQAPRQLRRKKWFEKLLNPRQTKPGR